MRGAVEAHHRASQGAERVTFDGFPDPGAPAAVLVALFEGDGETRVVLTRRAAHLRTHTGEVSFPGGRLDAGETPEAGALREAAEEVGSTPPRWRWWGGSPRSSPSPRVARITPVVGVAAGPAPCWWPTPTRWSTSSTCRWPSWPADGVFREERWIVPGRPMPVVDAGEDGSFPVWFFELPHDTVWGATARMLVELLRLVLDV